MEDKKTHVQSMRQADRLKEALRKRDGHRIYDGSNPQGL
jgi:hypothetical protein